MFRQKKLTLNTPYNKINKVLWENKRLNSQQLTENMQLKTHAQQLQRRVKDNTNQGKLNQKIIKKYEKLAQTYKRQANLINNINSQIEQRNYEQMKNTVKKIQNKLNLTATNALKLEKKLKISIRKQDRKCDQFVQKVQDQAEICNLQDEKNELDSNLQNKLKQLNQIQVRNKQLNRQLLNLLAIKNKLREQAKQYAKNSNKFLRKQTNQMTR